MTTIKMPVYNEITEEYEGEKNVDLEKELSEHAIKELNLKPEIKEEPLVTGGGSEPKKNPTFLKVDGSNLPNRVKNLVKFTNGSDDYLDDPIFINIEHITTIFCNPTTGNTIIFNGHSGQNWAVKESFEEVMKRIK